MSFGTEWMELVVIMLRKQRAAPRRFHSCVEYGNLKHMNLDKYISKDLGEVWCLSLRMGTEPGGSNIDLYTYHNLINHFKIISRNLKRGSAINKKKEKNPTKLVVYLDKQDKISLQRSF